MQTTTHIPLHVIARVIARCGVAHPFADLLAGKTALVAIELQNAFTDNAIGYAACPAGHKIVPRSNMLAGPLRVAGSDVALVASARYESSARNAMMLNVCTVMVSDANTAMTPDEHRASPFRFYSLFGDVIWSAFVMADLARVSHDGRSRVPWRG